MRLGHRSLLLGVISFAFLAGCDVGGSSSNDTGTTAGVAGVSTGGTAVGGVASGIATGGAPLASGNSVIATPSVAGTVAVATGASETVSVAFTSSDGVEISGFAISATSLPAGWSGPSDFTCAAVSNGNGCVLNLTYSPTAVGAGTLTLNYIYLDNVNMPKTPGGSLVIPYSATVGNNVIATVSPSGQINARVGMGTQPVIVNFTTDNGNAAAQLELTTDLTALPPGWTTTATAMSCAIVSTGSGCSLALNYAPTAGARGILPLSFSYIDDSGAVKTGAINIPFATTTTGQVIASASPGGQISVLQNAGHQNVAVTFTTDDGKPASNLYLVSNLKSLPAGWSSSSDAFSCAGIDAGNGCQLHLSYVPARLARGTFTLNYAYNANGGALRAGSVNIMYAATTDDNVVGAPSPSGPINTVVGAASSALSIVFNTDDGRPATALRISSDLAALPAGWSSTGTDFTCSGVGGASACELELTYAPTAAASGTLLLNYTYLNNAGDLKTGAVTVGYRATTDDTVVATASPSSLSVASGTSANMTITFATDDGNSASDLAVTSGLLTLPPDWQAVSNSLTCPTVSSSTTCRLSLTYSPSSATTGSLALAFTYTNNSGTIKTGVTTISYEASP